MDHRNAGRRAAILTSLVMMLGLLGASTAMAQSIVTNDYIGSAGGAWSTASNWSQGHAPTASERVTIAEAKSVVLSASSQIAEIDLEGTLQVSGGITLLVASTGNSGTSLISGTTAGSTASSIGKLRLFAPTELDTSTLGSLVDFAGPTRTTSAAVITLVGATYKQIQDTLTMSGTAKFTGSGALRVDTGTLQRPTAGVSAVEVAFDNDNVVALGNGADMRFSKGVLYADGSWTVDAASTLRFVSGSVVLTAPPIGQTGGVFGAGTVVQTTDIVSATAISTSGPWTVAAGKLTLNAPSNSVSSLSLGDSAERAGTGHLAVTGNGSTLTASGGSPGPTISGPTRFAGSVTLTAPDAATAALTSTADVTFDGISDVAGGRLNAPTGTLTIGGRTTVATASGGFGTAHVAVADAGTLVIVDGAGDTGYPSATFANAGQIILDATLPDTAGVELIGDGTTATGRFEARNGAVMRLRSHTLGATSRIASTGTVGLENLGVPAGALELTTADLKIRDVSIEGSHIVRTLTVSGTRSGTGTITATDGGTIAYGSFTGGLTRFGGPTTFDRTDGSGPVATASGGVVEIAGSAELPVGHELQSTGAGRFDVSGTLTADGGSLSGTPSGANLRVLPGGTLTSGADAAPISGIENDGTVRTGAGSAVIGLSAASTSTGAFVATNGRSLELRTPGGALALAAGQRLGGPGTIVVGPEATVSVPSEATLDPARIEVRPGGSLALQSARTLPDVRLDGGTLSGAGPLTAAHAELHRGTLATPLTISGTGVIDPSAEPIAYSADLRLAGPTTWSSGDLAPSAGADLVVTANFAPDSAAGDIVPAPGSVVTVQSGATLTHRSDVPRSVGALQVAGTLDIQAGSLVADAALAATGRLTGAGQLAGVVSGEGTVAPDGPLGIKNFAPGIGMTYELQVGPSFDERIETESAQLAGTLAILNETGYSPGPGTTEIAVAGAISGTWTAVTGRVLSNGRSWTGDQGVLTIVPRPPAQNTRPPTITGTAEQGQTVSCDGDQWDDASITRSYSWRRGDAEVGTSQTHQITADDTDVELRCRVTATNEGGSTPVVSAPVVPKPLKPELQADPVITGSTVQGGVLACGPGAYTNKVATLAYAWMRNGATIPNGTSTTYETVVEDVGAQITCVETASNSAGSAIGTSAPVTVTPKPANETVAPESANTVTPKPANETVAPESANDGASGSVLPALVAKDVIRLPPAKRCTRKRALKLTVVVPMDARLKRVRLRVGRRKTRTLIGLKPGRAFTVKSLPKRGSYSATVTVTLVDGRTASLTRKLRACR